MQRQNWKFHDLTCIKQALNILLFKVLFENCPSSNSMKWGTSEILYIMTRIPLPSFHQKKKQSPLSQSFGVNEPKPLECVLFNDGVNCWGCTGSAMDEWVCNSDGLTLTARKQKVLGGKTCPSATSFTTKPTETNLGLNLGLYYERSATNLLGHDTTPK